MPEIVARVLQYTPAECARLDGVFMTFLRDVHLRQGSVPADVLELVAPLHELAQEFRASVLVEPGSGTKFDRSGSVGGSSVVTERLSVQEAARLTGKSDSYLRRMARRGDVMASRSGHRGKWQLDGGSLAAWQAERNEHRKAA